MPWGSRFTGPVGRGSKGQLWRSRVAIRTREIHIQNPMVDGPFLLAPGGGIDLHYAVDLYQRVYSPDINQIPRNRTIVVGHALYSAPEYGGGEPPDADSTWTLVANTYRESNAHIVNWVQQEAPWFDGLTHVDLWTSVYQYPGDWTVPFTIVHELWANFAVWNRSQKDIYAVAATTEEPRPPVRDTGIRVLGKERG